MDAERDVRRRQKESYRAQQARLTARLKRVEGDAAAARDRLAALTMTLNETRARESAAVQLSPATAPANTIPAATAPANTAPATTAPANTAPAVTDQAAAGLPPWYSLAPHPLVADFTDPGTQYDSSAWFGAFPDPYDGPGLQYDGYGLPYDHSAPYNAHAYAGYPGPYNADSYAPPYYATGHGTVVQTLPAPRRRLLIAPFPQFALPALPPNPAPSPEPLPRTSPLRRLFRRPRRGKHARGRGD
ncbi:MULTISPECIES: hypothetical protein [Streptomyces]|uniref:hypothetical protein n=1 Tax=Streptomyces TaxID=1883 RepID=UPI000C66CE6D|nr:MULTISPECIES: hypothetical protein [Streptomyces]PIB07915.1 hypothetical protein B1C81_18325 [Streptomyces sp. HG99]